MYSGFSTANAVRRIYAIFALLVLLLPLGALCADKAKEAPLTYEEALQVKGPAQITIVATPMRIRSRRDKPVTSDTYWLWHMKDSEGHYKNLHVYTYYQHYKAAEWKAKLALEDEKECMLTVSVSKDGKWTTDSVAGLPRKDSLSDTLILCLIVLVPGGILLWRILSSGKSKHPARYYERPPYRPGKIIVTLAALGMLFGKHDHRH